MLTNLAIGRTVVPGLRGLDTSELEDCDAFGGTSFQVFMRAAKARGLTSRPARVAEAYFEQVASSRSSSVLSRVKNTYALIVISF
jgi:hypothetical protein